MTSPDDTVRAYIADLAAYNAGHLEGFWMDCSEDSHEMQTQISNYLKAQTTRHGELREEYAVHDWENAPSNWGEYPDWDEVANTVRAMEEHSTEVVLVACELGISIKDISDAYEGIFDDEKDWAYQYIDSCYDLHKMMGNLAHYFCYEAFARDAFITDMTGSHYNGNFHVFRQV